MSGVAPILRHLQFVKMVLAAHLKESYRTVEVALSANTRFDISADAGTGNAPQRGIVQFDVPSNHVFERELRHAQETNGAPRPTQGPKSQPQHPLHREILRCGRCALQPEHAPHRPHAIRKNVQIRMHTTADAGSIPGSLGNDVNGRPAQRNSSVISDCSESYKAANRTLQSLPPKAGREIHSRP